jgi:hypothetical protein
MSEWYRELLCHVAAMVPQVGSTRVVSVEDLKLTDLDLIVLKRPTRPPELTANDALDQKHQQNHRWNIYFKEWCYHSEKIIIVDHRLCEKINIHSS